MKHYSAVAILLLIFSFCGIGRLNAQMDTVLVTPESGVIDGSFIKPYTNKWKVTLTTPDGKTRDFRIWTDYMQKMNLDGKEFLHRVQDLYTPDGNMFASWTNMVDSKTLAPYMTYTNTPAGGFTFFRFDGSKVTGKRSKHPRKSGEVVDIDTAYSKSIYDWSLYGMLLVGLPLKEGLVVKIPYYGGATGESGFKILTVEVKEKEMTNMIDKKVEAWVVETSDNLRFSLIKEPPYVLKLVYTLPTGNILTWDMIK